MKKKGETTLQFLKELECLVRDVKETIRVGDDGFEACSMEQLDELIKVVREFAAGHLTPAAPPSKSALRYLAVADSFESGSPHTAEENVAWFKARLYYFIKRNLPKLSCLDEIPIANLESQIENQLIVGSSLEKEYFSDHWFYSGMAVLRDVTSEIADARRARPQRQLF